MNLAVPCGAPGPPQVLAFAALPHLALQPLAVAVWVQLGTAALSIATCSSTCSAALLGRPWLQQRTIAAAEFLQQAAAAVPLPMPSRVRVPGRCRAGPGSAACPAAWSSSGTPSPDLEAAALGACCALKSFAWLACCCILSLGLLHWRELEGGLAGMH